MANAVQEYLNWLDTIAGDDGKIFGITSNSEKPQIFVVKFDNLPEIDHSTSYSFGLSSINHKEWKYSRPELIVSVHSMDEAWGLAMGEVIKQTRFHSTFEYGKILNFGDQISEESEMSAFFIYVNSLYDKGIEKTELSDRTIQLSQLYPIYIEEIETIKKVGIEKFFSKLNIDFYDVRRKRVIL